MLVRISATDRDDMIECLRRVDCDPDRVEKLKSAKERVRSTLVRIDGHPIYTHNNYSAALTCEISPVDLRFASKKLPGDLNGYNLINVVYFLRGFGEQVDNYLVIDIAGHFKHDSWYFSLPEMLINREDGFRVRIDRVLWVGQHIVEFTKSNHGFHVLSPFRSKQILRNRRDHSNLTSAAQDLINNFYVANQVMESVKKTCDEVDLRKDKVAWMKRNFLQTPLYHFFRVWGEMKEEHVYGGPLAPFIDE